MAKGQNSISGIYLQNIIDPDGTSNKSYFAILQTLSSNLKATVILGEKDALSGKIPEALFNDPKYSSIQYIGYIDQNGVANLKHEEYDDMLQGKLTTFYSFKITDSNKLNVTYTWWLQGADKIEKKLNWVKIKSGFDLVNDYGETVRSIK